jgi:hypothetical protein
MPPKKLKKKVTPTYQTDIVRTIKHSDAIEKTLKVTKTGKGFNISAEEVRNIMNDIQNQANAKGDNIKIMIRGRAPLQVFTFKLYDTELNLLDFDEYLDGHVHDSTDLEMLDYVEFTVLKAN